MPSKLESRIQRTKQSVLKTRIVLAFTFPTDDRPLERTLLDLLVLKSRTNLRLMEQVSEVRRSIAEVDTTSIFDISVASDAKMKPSDVMSVRNLRPLPDMQFGDYAVYPQELTKADLTRQYRESRSLALDIEKRIWGYQRSSPTKKIIQKINYDTFDI